MEQKSFFNVATDEKIIKSNEKWFKLFNIVPMITTIIFAVAFFVLGIVLSIVSPMDGAAIPIFWGGGAVYCLLNYVIFKLILSYQILHIYYLKKITNGNVSIENSANDADEEELPEI